MLKKWESGYKSYLAFLQTRGNKNLDMGRYFYEIYIFAIFNAVTSSVT